MNKQERTKEQNTYLELLNDGIYNCDYEQYYIALVANMFDSYDTETETYMADIVKTLYKATDVEFWRNVIICHHNHLKWIATVKTQNGFDNSGFYQYAQDDIQAYMDMISVL